MTRTDIEQAYFDWMYHMVTDNRYGGEIRYHKLLTFLHDIEFRYVLSRDADRAEDGESLRRRFAFYNYEHEERGKVIDYLARPCSVLEMILALAIRCEDIMDDPAIGNRTGQWFWEMINTIGIGWMSDDAFDKDEALKKINIFMEREFEPDGEGGLFHIPNCHSDLRDVEFWVSMLWYLDHII